MRHFGFSDKLSSDETFDISIINKWWGKHTAHTINAAIAMKKNDQALLNKSLSELTSGAARWGDLVSRAFSPYFGSEMNQDDVRIQAEKLMHGHLDGAKELLIAYISKNGEPNAVRMAAEKLTNNTNIQEAFLNRAIYGFEPRNFIELFKEHIRLIFAYADALAKKDITKFRIATDLAKKNAERLDNFFESMFEQGGGSR